MVRELVLPASAPPKQNDRADGDIERSAGTPGDFLRSGEDAE